VKEFTNNVKEKALGEEVKKVYLQVIVCKNLKDELINY
jgi:signal recognition particle GTPase